MPDAQPPLGVPGAEGIPERAQIMGVDGHHADPQHVRLALRGHPGPLKALLEALVDRPQILAQPLADGGQPHRATGALEQGRPDGAFLLLDGLTDPRRRHMEPLGSTPEVQLLRKGQENLYVAQLHRDPAPFINPCVNHRCGIGRCSAPPPP